MLNKLKSEGYALAVLSNKPENQSQRIIDHFFPDLFDLVYGDVEGREKKPAPDGIFELMHRLQFKPGNAVMVGDSDTDIDAGKNAGIRPISVLWGYRSKDYLIEHGAVAFAENADELYEQITQ